MGWTGDLWWKKRIYMARLKAKSRCASSNIPFDIESSELVGLYEQNGGRCSLSGLPFKQTSNRGQAGMFSISLDRVRPELGYVSGNVRLILNCLNAMKGTETDEELIVVCKHVAERFK